MGKFWVSDYRRHWIYDLVDNTYEEVKEILNNTTGLMQRIDYRFNPVDSISLLNGRTFLRRQCAEVMPDGSITYYSNIGHTTDIIAHIIDGEHVPVWMAKRKLITLLGNDELVTLFELPKGQEFTEIVSVNFGDEDPVLVVRKYKEKIVYMLRDGELVPLYEIITDHNRIRATNYGLLIPLACETDDKILIRRKRYGKRPLRE
jgi:hypothetical protein